MKRYSQYMYSYPHKTAYRPLNGLHLGDFASCLRGPGHSLYLHIPFCQTKCGYCNLFSVTGQDEERVNRYLDRVERQLGQYQAALSPYHTEFSDFTIGGGTPLLLSEAQTGRVFDMVQSHLCLDHQGQIVIETAPNQTTAQKLKLLKQSGVTRISMGIQSFFDNELNTLRRNHSAKKAEEALALLMEFGFPCVNVDFIYGVPGQTVETFLKSLKKALAFEPMELFLYPLYVKHGVIMEQDMDRGMVLNEDLAYRQYLEGSAFLRSQGYVQDSMRRFVKRQSPDLRSFEDCGFGTSLSLGCGGRSYLGNLHVCTPYAVAQDDCLTQLGEFEHTEDYTVIRHGFLLSENEIQRRYLIRHLLILPGLDKNQYTAHFHTQAEQDFPVLKEWMALGYIKDGKDFISLTEVGMGLSDWIGPQLISPDVRSKMDEWEVLHGKTDHHLPWNFKKL